MYPLPDSVLCLGPSWALEWRQERSSTENVHASDLRRPRQPARPRFPKRKLLRVSGLEIQWSFLSEVEQPFQLNTEGCAFMDFTTQHC